MGYYSEVGYVVQGKKDEMVPILMAYRLNYEDPALAAAALSECTYNLEDDVLTIKFHAESMKWYDDYRDVKNHSWLFEAFREAAERDESSICGCYVRIGEEDTDVATDTYGSEPYDLVRSVRYVEFNVGAEDSLEDVLK